MSITTLFYGCHYKRAFRGNIPKDNFVTVPMTYSADEVRDEIEDEEEPPEFVFDDAAGDAGEEEAV